MEYLSDEWLAALADAVAACPIPGDESRPPSLVVEIVVTDVPGPDGPREVRYHLRLEATTAHLVAGGADDRAVRITQSYATAVAVATGARSAQHAFLAGDLRLGGDATALVAAAPALSAIDVATAAVRHRTSIPGIDPETT